MTDDQRRNINWVLNLDKEATPAMAAAALLIDLRDELRAVNQRLQIIAELLVTISERSK